MSIAKIGKPHSDDRKHKMSIAKSESLRIEKEKRYQKIIEEKIVILINGKLHSENTKRKMSEAKRRKKSEVLIKNSESRQSYEPSIGNTS